MNLDFLKYMKYNEVSLVPAIIQDEATGEVLMLAYMNQESLMKTLETGYTWFYSRSRSELWPKGQTSGHVQKVKDIFYDCDADTLLIKVDQTGAACHEGTFSCFTRKLTGEEFCAKPASEAAPGSDNLTSSPVNIIYELYNVITDRKTKKAEKDTQGSYTAYLFEKGQDKILKKVGEESAETIIASKNNNSKEIIYEMADLWYHCLVLMAYHDINPDELLAELKSRRK